MPFACSTLLDSFRCCVRCEHVARESNVSSRKFLAQHALVSTALRMHQRFTYSDRPSRYQSILLSLRQRIIQQTLRVARQYKHIVNIRIVGGIQRYGEYRYLHLQMIQRHRHADRHIVAIWKSCDCTTQTLQLSQYIWWYGISSDTIHIISSLVRPE